MTVRILIGCTIALLSGCVSEKAMLTNSNGQVIHCDNLGIGWLGAPIAMAQHSNCMKNAHAAGYSENPQPAPTAANQP